MADYIRKISIYCIGVFATCNQQYVWQYAENRMVRTIIVWDMNSTVHELAFELKIFRLTLAFERAQHYMTM
jgi:hypothetical protein